MLPNLATHYRNAMEVVYSIIPYVHESQYDSFRRRELILMANDISPWHYSVSVAKLWRSWVRDKDLSFLPISVFLGDKTHERYSQYRSQSSVELTPLNSVVCFSNALSFEQDLAVLFIRGVMIGEITESEAEYFSIAYMDYDPAVKRVACWLEYLNNGWRRPLQYRILDRLCRSMAISLYCNDYTEYIKAYIIHMGSECEKLTQRAHDKSYPISSRIAWKKKATRRFREFREYQDNANEYFHNL